MSQSLTLDLAEVRMSDVGRVGGKSASLGEMISQLAGGVLTILIIPLLRLFSPAGPWVTVAAAVLFAVGLLMPIAFAVGVWKYRVLDLDPNALP